jgi:hypothetical protein
MTNPTQYDLSPLALAEEARTPSFTFPIHTDNPLVYSISLDLTSDDDVSIVDPAEISRSRKQSEPIFLPNLSDSYQIPSRPLGFYSADPWPVGFTREEWTYVWDSEPLRIEQFLRRTSHADPLRSPVTKEDQFKGVPWRITIEPQEKGIVIPMFTHGRVVTYRNCNRMHRRYIIDHCAYQEEDTAYLRVICFASRQKVFSAQSLYPPFILAIPRRLCDARMHPDFDITSLIESNTSTSDIQQDVPAPPILSYLSMDEEQKPGRFAGLLRALLKLICYR